MELSKKNYTRLCQINATLNLMAGVVDTAKQNNWLVEQGNYETFFPKGIIDNLIYKQIIDCLDNVQVLLIDHADLDRD